MEEKKPMTLAQWRKVHPEVKNYFNLRYRRYKKEWREAHKEKREQEGKGMGVGNVGIGEEIVKVVADVVGAQAPAGAPAPRLDIGKLAEQHKAQVEQAMGALREIPPLLRDTNVPPTIADHLLSIHASLKEIEPLGAVLLNSYAKRVELVEKRLAQEEVDERKRRESNAAVDRLEKQLIEHMDAPTKKKAKA